jgi:lipopolysaccharide export system protein LptA
MSFKGKYLDKPFRGEADQMKFNFLDNRIFFNKDLVIIFDEKEYKGRNIEIDTQLQSIIDSDKITINAVNDFKSR